MAWVSTDLVACMALHVVHHAPDVLVLYHGAGELYLYVTDESEGGSSVFRHDYSHNRRNVGVQLWKHRLVNKKILDELLPTQETVFRVLNLFEKNPPLRCRCAANSDKQMRRGKHALKRASY